MYLYMVLFSFKQIQVKKELQSYLNWWKLLMCGMRNHRFLTRISEEDLFYFFQVIAKFLIKQLEKLSQSRCSNLFWFQNKNKPFIICNNSPNNRLNYIVSLFETMKNWSVVRKKENESWKLESEKYQFPMPHINQFKI